MNAKLIALTCIAACLIMGGLFASACTSVQTTPTMEAQEGMTPQGGETEIGSNQSQTAQETTALGGMTSQGGETDASDIQSPVAAPVTTAIASHEVKRSSENNPKLDSSLNQLLDAYRSGGLAEAQTFAESHRMLLDDDRVQVEIVVAGEEISNLSEAIETAGGEYQGHYKTLLQALAPLDALESLAERADVEMIREPRKAES